jgi:hypothetical protein
VVDEAMVDVVEEVGVMEDMVALVGWDNKDNNYTNCNKVYIGQLIP